jgi:hypothetical protein
MLPSPFDIQGDSHPIAIVFIVLYTIAFMMFHTMVLFGKTLLYIYRAINKKQGSDDTGYYNPACKEVTHTHTQTTEIIYSDERLSSHDYEKAYELLTNKYDGRTRL